MGDEHKYKVKDRHGKVDRDISEHRILSRIERGKYTGEEEVSLPPYEEWQKLSSIPLFYDALMKRLFESEYQQEESPKEEAPKEEENEKEEAATRRAKEGELAGKTKHASEGEAHPKTQNIAKDPTRVEGTIDQALIQELFKDEGSEVEDVQEAQAPAEEREISMGEAPEDQMAVPLDEAPPEEKLSEPLNPSSEIPEEGQLKQEEKKKLGTKKILLWSLVLVALLLLLVDDDSGPTDISQTANVDNSAPKRAVIADTKKLKQKVDGLVWEGNQIYQQDNGQYYVQAAAIFQEASEYDPKSSEAFSGLAQSLAMSLYNGKNIAKVTTQVQSAIRRGRSTDPQSSAFYRAEAILALHQQQLEPARQFIRQAIDTDPTSPENALVLGEISYAFKDLDTARASLVEAAKSRKTKVRALYFMARAAVDLGDINSAKQYLSQISSISPLHQGSHLLSGDIALAQGRNEEALSHYRMATRLAALASSLKAGEAAYKLANLYELLGQQVEAGELYVLANYFDPKVAANIGTKTSGLDTSVQNAKELLKKYTLGKDQYALRGETYYRQKDPERAFLYYQAANVLAPSDGRLLLRLGELVEENAIYYEDFLRVVGFYERAIDRDATLARAYIKLGLLETEQYNLERGIRLLLQAKGLAPNDRDTRVALGKHYYKRQDYSRALDEFLAASQLKENDSEVLYYAGKMRLLFTKDQRQAMTFFERSYKSDPFNYKALVEWLRLKVFNFDKNFAIKFINNLLEKEPTNAKYYWVLGEVYLANKDYRKAVRQFQRSLDFDNKDSNVRLSLGKALEADGKIEKAILEYRLASRLNRRNLEGFFRAGELLIAAKKFKEAEGVLKILIETSPKYPGAHLYLSRVYRATKKKDAALKALDIEVSNNPRNTKFRVELAETYMQYRDFENAVKQLTEITNLPQASEAPEFLYDKIRAYLLLSRCYRQLGKYESAEGAISLAMQLDSQDPLLHRELGYVYVALQRNIEAAASFKTYLKRSPAAQDAGTIKKLINRLVIPE